MSNIDTSPEALAALKNRLRRFSADQTKEVWGVLTYTADVIAALEAERDEWIQHSRLMDRDYAQIAAERDAALADAKRYRYLRDRKPADVLGERGPSAGCWIDCDDEDGELCLLTGEDADAAIDVALAEVKP